MTRESLRGNSEGGIQGGPTRLPHLSSPPPFRHRSRWANAPDILLLYQIPDITQVRSRRISHSPATALRPGPPGSPSSGTARLSCTYIAARYICFAMPRQRPIKTGPVPIWHRPRCMLSPQSIISIVLRAPDRASRWRLSKGSGSQPDGRPEYRRYTANRLRRAWDYPGHRRRYRAPSRCSGRHRLTH